MTRTAAVMLLACLVTPAFAVPPSPPPPGTPWSDSNFGTTTTGDFYSSGRNAVGGVAAGHGKPAVQIYVVDSGVGNHYELPNVTRLSVPAYASVSGIGCYAHATHVAGVIAGKLNTSLTAGVFAGAPIISVSTLTTNLPASDGTQCGFGPETADSIVKALDVVYHSILNSGSPPAVVNLSTNLEAPDANSPAGEYQPNGVIYNEIRKLVTPDPTTSPPYRGALVVQAAGNQYADACAHAYMANAQGADPYDGVLVVGGLNDYGVPVIQRYGPLDGYSNHFGDQTSTEPGSNYGRCVDVWAPSGDYNHAILSAWANSAELILPTPTTDGNPTTYQNSAISANLLALDGTSFAAPHVAALAAAFWQLHPSYSPQDVEYYVRANSTFLGTDTYGYAVRMPFNVVASNADDIIQGFYRNIVQRGADQGGRTFWDQEVERVHDLGMDRHDAYKAVAKQFFFGQEYANLGRSDTQFIMDLYAALFGRAADGGGLAYWQGQIASGLNREAVFTSFANNAEFYNYVTATLGPSTEAPVVGIFADMNRGAWGAQPTTPNFNLYAGRLCGYQGNYSSLLNEIDTQMRNNFNSYSYSQRYRTDRQFVADLYDAMFRRDVDVGGFNFWSTSGVQTFGRAGVLEYLLASQEWTNRVSAAVGHACPP